MPESDHPEAVGLHTHPATAFVRTWLWLAAGFLSGLRFAAEERPGLKILLTILGALVVGSLIGLVLWWFTRYVIDGEELRIESGVVTKRSRRIPYERIQSVDLAQPLAARVLGLAELRIDMAGGQGSRSRLQFLRVADAYELRTLLLTRAHADHSGADEPEVPGTRTGQVITVVPPHRLILGTLVTVDFAIALVAAVGLAVGALLVPGSLGALSLAVPFAIWAFELAGKRVIAQWGFTLTRTHRGLRIDRGLLTTVSQTVPYDRVQAIRIRQPIVWRLFGWEHLEVGVAGYAGESDDETPTSMLLPVGPSRRCREITSMLLPGVDAYRIPETRAPSSAMLLAPIGWRYIRAGADDHAFVGEHGWVEHKTDLVPHNKTVSVALRQGPIQRLVDLASVHVHTPDGPVRAFGRDLEAPAARAMLLAQLDRARADRAREAGRDGSAAGGTVLGGGIEGDRLA